MNFIDLKAAMLDWLGLTDDECPNNIRGQIINIVMRHYCRLRESRFGEFSDVFRTRQFIRDYPTPVGWSKPRDFWYPSQTSTNPNDITWVTYKDKTTFDQMFPASGLFGSTFSVPMGTGAFGEGNLGFPCVYTVWAGKIMLGPVPNTVFTIYRNFWRIPPDLTDDDPESDFTIQAWEYLLFASLVKACEFGYENDQLPIWQAELEDMKIDLTIEDARARTVQRQPVSTEPG